MTPSTLSNLRTAVKPQDDGDEMMSIAKKDLRELLEQAEWPYPISMLVLGMVVVAMAMIIIGTLRGWH